MYSVHNDFFPKSTVSKRRKKQLYSGKRWQTTPAKCSRSVTRVITCFDSMYPLHDVMKWLFTSVTFLSKTQSPSLIMRKISDKSKLRIILNYSQKIPDLYFPQLPRSSKTGKVWDTVTSKRSLKVTWQLNEYNILEQKKDIKLKTEEIWIKNGF